MASRDDEEAEGTEYDYFDETEQERVYQTGLKEGEARWRKVMRGTFRDIEDKIFKCPFPSERELRELRKQRPPKKEGRKEDAPCSLHSARCLGHSKRYLPAERRVFPHGDSKSEEYGVRFDLPFHLCFHHFKRVGWTGLDRRRTGGLRERNVDLHYYVICYRGPPLGKDEPTVRVFEGADLSTRDRIQQLAWANDIEIYPVDIGEDDGDGLEDIYIVFSTHNRKDAHLAFRHIVSLTKGEYLRGEGGRLDRLRNRWKLKAETAYDNGDRKAARINSQKKKRYASSMEFAHERAAEELFKFFNTGNSWDKIDLHHMRIADSEAKTRLTEAMEKVRLTKVNTAERAKWLEVIPGAGLHSKKAKGKLYTHVLKLLKNWKESKTFGEFEMDEVNRGAFVLTFDKYTGSFPAFGFFYCNHPKCGPRSQLGSLGRSWGSKETWEGFGQACHACHKARRWSPNVNPPVTFPCRPFKIQSLDMPRPRYSRSYTRGVEGSGGIPHNPELCEKCRSIGRPCVPYV